MRVNDSDRTVLVTESENTVAISVIQPSDCLSLRSDHVIYTDYLDIRVSFEYTSVVNGPSQTDPPEVWEKALLHLLNIYDPSFCYIHTDDRETGIDDEVRVQTESNTVYMGFWNETRSVLSLAR